MLLAAAVCPHPLLLVPEVAAGAAPELDGLRAACRTAIATLPSPTFIVGSAQAVGIGAWLLPTGVPQVVDSDIPPAALGASLAADDIGLLVMGDGSARRSAAAPGYYDERAAPYDAAVVAALRDADPAALLALDPADDDALLVAGRAAWQVLAGAAGDQKYRGAILFDEAPYGVGYFVATWSRA